MINLQSLIDDAKCYETVRQLCWPEGVHCPHCYAHQVTKQGRDRTQPVRQKYCCTACQQRGGEEVIPMLENVQQTTIEPLIRATIAPGRADWNPY
jgi:hypothetical protein